MDNPHIEQLLNKLKLSKGRSLIDAYRENTPETTFSVEEMITCGFTRKDGDDNEFYLKCPSWYLEECLPPEGKELYVDKDPRSILNESIEKITVTKEVYRSLYDLFSIRDYYIGPFKKENIENDKEKV